MQVRHVDNNVQVDMGQQRVGETWDNNVQVRHVDNNVQVRHVDNNV